VDEFESERLLITLKEMNRLAQADIELFTKVSLPLPFPADR
jgi:hypothetical protein